MVRFGGTLDYHLIGDDLQIPRTTNLNGEIQFTGRKDSNFEGYVEGLPHLKRYDIQGNIYFQDKSIVAFQTFDPSFPSPIHRVLLKGERSLRKSHFTGILMNLSQNSTLPTNEIEEEVKKYFDFETRRTRESNDELWKLRDIKFYS